MKLAFFGSSLVSAYWNGAATYYRGILRALAGLDYRTTFYEPDAYGRQQHRDIPDPDWAAVVVYDAATTAPLERCLEEAARADIVVKASGVGVFDPLLEERVATMPGPSLRVFWDVDAPATLDRMHRNPADPFCRHLAQFDLVFTYGGGPPVVEAYQALGARSCVPIYNAVDPDIHRPEAGDPRFAADLSFLGNRLPDREARVQDFFFQAAWRSPGSRFLLGGSGWQDVLLPTNARYVGHVYTADHNRFNCSARAVLNVCRESMARYGYSPATRIFEAAGAGACIISDVWPGVDSFLQPETEILLADNGAGVAALVNELTETRAAEIGAQARRRVLAHHTYAQRALQVDAAIKNGRCAGVATV